MPAKNAGPEAAERAELAAALYMTMGVLYQLLNGGKWDKGSAKVDIADVMESIRLRYADAWGVPAERNGELPTETR